MNVFDRINTKIVNVINKMINIIFFYLFIRVLLYNTMTQRIRNNVYSRHLLCRSIMHHPIVLFRNNR